MEDDVRALLWVVLAHGQRPWQRLGRELVVEAAHVLELAVSGSTRSRSITIAPPAATAATAAAVSPRLTAGTFHVCHRCGGARG